jgi:hypothetical protein
MSKYLLFFDIWLLDDAYIDTLAYSYTQDSSRNFNIYIKSEKFNMKCITFYKL